MNICVLHDFDAPVSSPGWEPIQLKHLFVLRLSLVWKVASVVASPQSSSYYPKLGHGIATSSRTRDVNLGRPTHQTAHPYAVPGVRPVRYKGSPE